MTETLKTKTIPLQSQKQLLCDLLRQFYDLGWCTGTGGGLSCRTEDGYLMAPSGVAKERVLAHELFEMNQQFEITNLDSLENKKVSECAPLFQAIYERTDAGAVIHTHGLPLVVAMHRRRGYKTLSWTRVEMLKGIRGVGYLDEHHVPIIENTPRECELTDSLTEALKNLPENAHGVFVRDHGAYIWGRTVMEAKRHTEVYDWLSRYTNAIS